MDYDGSTLSLHQSTEVVSMARDMFASNFRWPVAEAGYGWLFGQLPKEVCIDEPNGRGGWESVWLSADALDEPPWPPGAKWRGEDDPDDDEYWFLADCDRQGGSRYYAPLRETTALFRTFARTPLTRAGIADFANQYGLLGAGVTIDLIDPRRPEPDVEEPRVGDPSEKLGEPFGAWVYQIVSMRRADDLWDAINRRDETKLRQHIHWVRRSDAHSVHYNPDPSVDFNESTPWGQLASTRETPELIRQISTGDVYAPAWLYISRAINEHLPTSVRFEAAWPAERAGLPLQFAPTGLLGAMWLQFALAVAGNKRYRACESCGTWYEVTPLVARKSKMFCSGACRIRHFRKRQEQAWAMKAEGKTANTIAKALETDPETVRGWLKKKKGE
jgi:hypothetical protein